MVLNKSSDVISDMNGFKNHFNEVFLNSVFDKVFQGSFKTSDSDSSENFLQEDDELKPYMFEHVKSFFINILFWKRMYHKERRFQTRVFTTLAAIHNLCGDKHSLCNRSYRLAAYKQYIWWVYGWLGKHKRRIIPSCYLGHTR